MAWCDRCDLRLEEDEVSDEGACIYCGEEPVEHRSSAWYVKVLVVITVIYLGYRTYQGVTWLVHHV
jgi:hypothetical protein